MASLRSNHRNTDNLKPDYNLWLIQDFWSCNEAAALLLEIDPDKVLEFDCTGYGGSYNKDINENALKKFKSYSKALEKHFGLDSETLTPVNVVMWAEEKEIAIPEELYRLLRDQIKAKKEIEQIKKISENREKRLHEAFQKYARYETLSLIDIAHLLNNINPNEAKDENGNYKTDRSGNYENYIIKDTLDLLINKFGDRGNSLREYAKITPQELIEWADSKDIEVPKVFRGLLEKYLNIVSQKTSIPKSKPKNNNNINSGKRGKKPIKRIEVKAKMKNDHEEGMDLFTLKQKQLAHNYSCSRETAVKALKELQEELNCQN
jgi:hypothetical protein